MSDMLQGQTEIAEALGISVRTLRRWLASEDRPPVRRVHGVFYAREIELLEWISGHARQDRMCPGTRVDGARGASWYRIAA